MKQPIVRVQARYGRPRELTGANAHGGREAVRFVVEAGLKAKLNAVAVKQRVTLSEVLRRACRAYVEGAER